MPEGDQAEGRFEDLFEDLDKFFAPIEQVDRPLRDPLPGPSGSSAGAPGPPPPVEAPRKPEAGSEREIVSPAAAATDDREPDATDLPPGEPPLGSRDEGPAGPDWMYGVVEDESEMQMESQPAPLPEPEMPAGEMTGEDWSRLRDVLGDEAQGEEIEFAAASSEPPLDSEEEQHELTLDDLKKAPPEYRDLPGVEKAGEPPPASQPPAQPPAPPAPPFDAEPDPLEAPPIADVEAVADRLAEELGDSEEALDDEGIPPADEPVGPRTVVVGEPESMMGGPTWEEPTGSHALVTEPGGPAKTGRDLPVAVLTGVVLFLVAAISLLVAKAAFVVVGGAVVLLGQAELYATIHRNHYQPATALGLVIGGLLMAGGYLKGEVAMTFFLAFVMVLVFLWYMAGTMKGRENAIANIGSTLLGVIYVPFLATYAFLLLAQANSGRTLMLVVIGLTVAYDIAAFFFGTFWGSHPLAPTISPKKSREGLLGATVVTFALAIGIVPSVIDYLSVTNAVGLAVIVSVFAPLGDLAESALKRDLGVKDMGSILPGHGGILDRIDSLLFVAPAAWYFLRLIL